MADLLPSIFFNVNARDAAYLLKDLQGRVGVEDIIKLPKFRAIARIGTEIVRFDTRKPRAELEPNFRQQIIANSRQRYYRPAQKVRQAIRNRRTRWGQRYSPSTELAETSSHGAGTIEELTYDVF